MVNYKIKPNLLAHQWQIELNIKQNKALPLEISLPNWVPGSYMIRDFSRHIIEINAFCDGKSASLTQLNKNHWQTETLTGEWQIYYTIYAFDLSVRSSFLSSERGFFDGSCLFLQISGAEHLPHHIYIEGLPPRWQIASVLTQCADNHFCAESYAELIDHPFELGCFETLHFEAAGITHRIILSGYYADFDRARLVDDIRQICTAELNNFPFPAPFKKYTFFLYVGDNLYGGLEHRSSTALHADRNSLPTYGLKEANEAYTQLLGLFSHEYFHAWNIKSIKPALFIPYNLNQETYTEQLWAFEGITSYYDDLFLVRSGVISIEAYLQLIAQNLTRVQQSKGRLKQTLAQSSFSAWDKYYKQNENSPNAIVSYYQKGALAALCLDSQIREKSNDHQTLDIVMQQLYRDWCSNQKGIPEGYWQKYCQTITKLDLSEFFQTALYTTHDLPLTKCLAQFGIELQWHALPRSHGGALVKEFPEPNPATDFGARYKQNTDNITLTHVLNGSSAEEAGLCPQDKIIAVNGFACTDFNSHWTRFEIGERVLLHYFREGVLHETVLIAQAAEAETALLKITDEAKLKTWLQQTSIQNQL